MKILKHKLIKKHVKKVKHKVKTASKKIFLSYLSDLLYITGLTIVIPTLFLLALPEEIGNFDISTAILFVVTIPLIFAGVFVRYHLSNKNPGKMCKCLGMLTLIPGMVALFLLIFSKEAIMKTLDATIPQIQNAARIDFLLSIYLEKVVPSVSTAILAYLVIGLTLYLYGIRREKGPTF